MFGWLVLPHKYIVLVPPPTGLALSPTIADIVDVLHGGCCLVHSLVVQIGILATPEECLTGVLGFPSSLRKSSSYSSYEIVRLSSGTATYAARWAP